MSNYRFQLEKYKGMNSRYYCPNCNKREFVRYLDQYENKHIDSKVGRCNREEKCGYHYTPKQFFTNKTIPQTDSKWFIKNNIKRQQETFFFDKKTLSATLNDKVKTSNLYQFLISKFDENKVDKTLQKYLVGTSNKWSNSNVFWQIDSHCNIRAGKIMVYDSYTGRRDKTKFNWYKVPFGYGMKQCFFGAHLLKSSPKDIQIGIVESEKTALICDIAMGENILWLSTCGLRGINLDKFVELKDRQVILFPDLSCSNAKINAMDLWKSQAEIIKKDINIDIRINNFIEKKASKLQREEQWDIADFIMQ